MSLHKKYGTVVHNDAPEHFDSFLTPTSAIGPVVRISPNELSIDDTDAHNSIIYSHASDFMKVNAPKSPIIAMGPY